MLSKRVMANIGLLLLVLWGSFIGIGGCTAGIRSPGSATGTEGAGLPGVPQQTVLSPSRGGGALLSSSSFGIYLTVAPASFRGGTQGGPFELSDPLVEGAAEGLLGE